VRKWTELTSLIQLDPDLFSCLRIVLLLYISIFRKVQGQRPGEGSPTPPWKIINISCISKGYSPDTTNGNFKAGKCNKKKLINARKV